MSIELCKLYGKEGHILSDSKGKPMRIDIQEIKPNGDLEDLCLEDGDQLIICKKEKRKG